VGQEVLERPVYGPWTVVNDPQAAPALGQGSFAEAVYTVALQCFIEAEQLAKAEEAMKGLERLAGDGEEASAKLTAMYFTMGRNLQGQLGSQAQAANNGDANAAQKAAVTLAGFETFLERLAGRDKKVSSQMWIATTYLSLGSGKDMGRIVPQDKAEQYLDRAAAVYAGLLKKKDDQTAPQAERDEITTFEPSIRLRMASIFKERGKWDEALEQIDWILKDPKRQNSLDTQVQAAELLQAAGLEAAGENPGRAEALLKEAIVGRKQGGSVIWGWNGLANKLSRQASAGTDEKSLRSRTLFFESRLAVAACLLDRAKLPGKPKEQADELLGKAVTAISTTRKMYPDLGGDAMAARYEKVLKDTQKKQGTVNPRGFAELDDQAAARAAAATPQEK
jgi:tetratricopeptide (TPR) repeat protein